MVSDNIQSSDAIPSPPANQAPQNPNNDFSTEKQGPTSESLESCEHLKEEESTFEAQFAEQKEENGSADAYSSARCESGTGAEEASAATEPKDPELPPGVPLSPPNAVATVQPSARVTEEKCPNSSVAFSSEAKIQPSSLELGNAVPINDSVTEKSGDVAEETQGEVVDAGDGTLVPQDGSTEKSSADGSRPVESSIVGKNEEIIVFSAPLKVVGEGGDGEVVLGDEPIGPPLKLRVLTREEELAEFELLNGEGSSEPPLKKIRLAEEESNGSVRRTIESAAFEEAFQQTNVPFRTSIEEGAHHVIRKKEVNVKFGLAMWAAALQQMLFDGAYVEEACGYEGGCNEGTSSSQVEETQDSLVPPPVAGSSSQDSSKVEAAAEEGAGKRASCLSLKETQENELRAGLSYLERIGGHVAGSGGSEGSFAYKSGSSLTICGVEMYDAVNNLIVSVISRRGENVGERVVDFLRQIVSLGKAVMSLGLVVLTAGKSESQISKPPGNILLLPPAAGTQQHMMRIAKTTATLTAISRFALKSPADIPPSAAPPAPPPTVPSVLPPMVVRPPPAQPPIPSPFDLHLPPHPPQQRPQPRYPPPVAPPPAAAAPVVPAPSAFLRARLPPPSLAARFLAPARPAIPPTQPFNPALQPPTSLHQRPPTVINLWTDPRLLELPDWVVSTLVDMVYRYDGHVIAAVDQCWYSCYGAQINFRLFGFTGLHDVLANIPGVTLKQEGSEFWVQVNGPLLQEAVRQKWTTPGSRPAAGGQLPAEVLDLVNWRARQMQTNLLLTAQGGMTRIPPRICARLLELVRLNEGSNIGHIQQQWRQVNQSEQLDVAALGYTKFSDLLQDVPGVQIVKEGSTVTAHTTKTPCPLPPGVQAAAALKGVGGKTPYDHQQQIQMMRQMLQMQMQLATMASLQNGAR